MKKWRNNEIEYTNSGRRSHCLKFVSCKGRTENFCQCTYRKMEDVCTLLKVLMHTDARNPVW